MEHATGKSADAFRTIGEVAADLNIPQHILRFWEGKFPQLRPVKRSGNRRYYRPEDVALVRRINALLNEDGYTISGVQRLLKQRRGEAPAIASVSSSPAPAAPLIQHTDAPGLPLTYDRFDRAAMQTIRDLLVDALERTR